MGVGRGTRRERGGGRVMWEGECGEGAGRGEENGEWEIGGMVVVMGGVGWW